MACTTLTYAWVPFWGIIAASVVAGIYGKKAADMADKIDEMKTLIADETTKVQDEKRLIADLNAVSVRIKLSAPREHMALTTSTQTDLTNFYNSIDPAVTALRNMITVWDNISTQLTNLQSIVANDVQKANASTATHTDAILVAKWNALKVAGEDYLFPV